MALIGDKNATLITEKNMITEESCYALGPFRISPFHSGKYA